MRGDGPAVVREGALWIQLDLIAAWSFADDNWEGETLVEHSTWKIRGLKLGFERRFEFTGGWQGT